jgi:site-specific DNA-methyltransferase (adenine-specific)
MTDKPRIYFQNKNLAIINDDVLTTNEVSPDSVDLIVTSPPYNVGMKYNSHDDGITYDEYKEFSKNWMARCYEWLKEDGRFCLNIPLDKNKGGQQSVGADLTTIAKQVGFKYHTTIIWNEGTISRRTAWGSFQSASAPFIITPVELIVVFYKKVWKKQGLRKDDILKNDFKEWTNGLWTFSGESKIKIGHPAPFPVELPRRCILLFSYKEDTILDPFLGSGTTLIAASLNDRKGIGIEIDPQYCKIALVRLKKEGKLGQFSLKTYIEIKDEPKEEDTRISKHDVILKYFQENPSREITYQEIANWIKTEYIRETGLDIEYHDKIMRDLAHNGKIKKIGKGVFRYK